MGIIVFVQMPFKPHLVRERHDNFSDSFKYNTTSGGKIKGAPIKFYSGLALYLKCNRGDASYREQSSSLVFRERSGATITVQRHVGRWIHLQQSCNSQ